MSHEQRETWISLQDPQLSSEALAARVETQLTRRRRELGRVTQRFPDFQTQPSEIEDDENGEALQQALRQLQTLPPPPTQATLSPSLVTRLPVLGRLWRLIRAQSHELVLFYVNRQLAHQTQTNHLVFRALQGMHTQLAQQAAHITALESRLAALEARLAAPQPQSSPDQDHTLDRE
jgi:uncharacterized coiled-coil protein SlyX